MSLGAAFSVVQGTVWVIQNIYNASYYYFYNGDSTDEELQQKIDKLQMEVREIRESEKRKERLMEMDRLRRIQQIRANQEARGTVRSTDPMAQSCPNIAVLGKPHC